MAYSLFQNIRALSATLLRRLSKPGNDLTWKCWLAMHLHSRLKRGSIIFLKTCGSITSMTSSTSFKNMTLDWIETLSGLFKPLLDYGTSARTSTTPWLLAPSKWDPFRWTEPRNMLIEGGMSKAETSGNLWCQIGASLNYPRTPWIRYFLQDELPNNWSRWSRTLWRGIRTRRRNVLCSSLMGIANPVTILPRISRISEIPLCRSVSYM